MSLLAKRVLLGKWKNPNYASAILNVLVCGRFCDDCFDDCEEDQTLTNSSVVGLKLLQRQKRPSRQHMVFKFCGGGGEGGGEKIQFLGRK